MKLRVKGNTLRLRLTKTEVDKFGKEGRVKESVHFGPAKEHHFHYEIAVTTADTLSATYEDNTIRVNVPQATAHLWVTSDEVGFEYETGTDNEHIHILVEKDFQCLHRDVADEPDNYANPLAK